MKLSYNSFFIIGFLCLTACSKPAENADPKMKLAELKAQVKELNQQIKELQLQIDESDTSNVQAKSKLVQLDTLSKREFKHFVEVQGMIDARHNVLVAPQMPGVVTSVNVREGSFVNAGQILASLDGATIRKGIDEIKTGWNMANTMYEKQKRLWEQNIGSEAQYLQAKNQKEQLEQKLKTLESQLSMTHIKSPISGVVDAVNIKAGEMATPGISGIRVVNDKEMRVQAKLSDSYLGKIKKGDKVILYFPDTDKSIESKISFISKTINPTTRTFIVEVDLPSGKQNYLSNQAVKLKINNGILKDVLVVSSNLIQKSINGENYILIAEESNGSWYAKKRIIETGVEYSGETQIKSGLKPGDKIIVSGFGELVDGQLISL
jgi:membrane fusion protein (multidrug efflux system)